MTNHKKECSSNKRCPGGNCLNETQYVSPCYPCDCQPELEKEGYVMKGNEQDCICAKIGGKHEKHCDVYRLSEFMKKSASALSFPVKESWESEFESLWESSFDREGDKNTFEFERLKSFIFSLLESEREKWDKEAKDFHDEHCKDKCDESYRLGKEDFKKELIYKVENNGEWNATVEKILKIINEMK